MSELTKKSINKIDVRQKYINASKYKVSLIITHSNAYLCSNSVEFSLKVHQLSHHKFLCGSNNKTADPQAMFDFHKQTNTST